jgi:hypothetical protein
MYASFLGKLLSFFISFYSIFCSQIILKRNDIFLNLCYILGDRGLLIFVLPSLIFNHFLPFI